MLGIPECVRIYYCPQPVNMHLSFDGLPGIIHSILQKEPLDGSLYVFFSRRRTMVKILCWEGDGFSIWSKRLERGQFNLPVSADGRITLEARELQAILAGIKPQRYYRRYKSCI